VPTEHPAEAAEGSKGGASLAGSERRLQVIAYEEWLKLARDKYLPTIADMQGISLDTMNGDDFKEKCFALNVSEELEDPEFVFIGDDLLEDCRDCGNIEKQSQVPSRTLLSRFSDHYMQCVANAAPVGFEATFVNRKDIQIHYRGILLPISNDGQRIDHVWGSVSHKADAESAPAKEPDAPAKQCAGQADEARAVAQDGVLASRSAAKKKAKVAEVEKSAPPIDASWAKALLSQCLSIDGVLAAALVDCAKGAAVAEGGAWEGASIDLCVEGVSLTINTQRKMFERMGLGEGLEDILISQDHQYQIINPMPDPAMNDIFLVIVIEKTKSNLGMIKFKMSQIKFD